MTHQISAIDDHTDANRNEPIAASRDTRLRWGARLIALAGVLFIANGFVSLYRVFFTDGFEMGVHQLDGMTASELATAYPDVGSYIAHVHVSFAGLMIAAGVGITALAWYGIRAGKRWALATTIAIPLIFAGFTMPVHQTVHFDFHALIHLGPAGIGFPLFVGGGLLALLGIRSIEASTTTEAEG